MVENGRVVRKELSHEKGIVTSSVNYNSILNITFKIPKSVEKDMLEYEAEKYILKDGSLDLSKDYKINFFFKEYEEFYNVEALAVEEEKLKEDFEKFVKVYKFIDFISAKPLAYQAYYDIKNEKPKTDIFIHFTKDEAFLSCFEDGEFVFVKSVHKLSNLAVQIDMSLDETVELINKNGIIKDHYDDEVVYSAVDAFFSQFFSKVSNIVNHAFNYYGFKKIDTIYFYSPFEIDGLFHAYKEYWKLSGIEFKKYEIPTDYDAFDYTCSVYNSKHHTNEAENFTIFPRPVPFYKTRSGVFFTTALVLFALLGIDTAYKYKILYSQQNEITELRKKIALDKRKYKLLQSMIKKYEVKLASAKKVNKALKEELSDIESKIDFLTSIQHQRPFSNVMADVVNIMKKYGLKLSSFTKKEKHYEIYIISKFDNSYNIASFMKEISTLGYKNVNSETIINTKDIYVSKVGYDE